MTQVTDSYNRLDQLLSVADRNGSVYGKFETIESENFDLLRKQSEYIREIDDSKARSEVSRRSCVSKRSRSSLISNASKKADAAAEAAALRVKLKYIETEAKHKAQLEKLQT